MSGVYFHSPSGTATLRGSERAHLNLAVRDLGNAMLDAQHNADILRAALPAGHYLRNVQDAQWANFFRIAQAEALPLVIDGTEVDVWDINLNTAIALGNDAVKLAARIHAQCEIHAWVDGPNRAWLAAIIQGGRASGFYRADAGWEAVIELLLSRDDEPVVLSYSVTDPFPNVHTSDRMPDWPAGLPERWDALTEAQQEERERIAEEWYELDEATQWAACMPTLRASGGGLELTPDHWDDFRFGAGHTAMSALDALRSTRVSVKGER